MTATFALVGLVVRDMSATLAFYRRLGLDLPSDADTEPHVDLALPGIRLAFDTVETIKSFDPDWQPPSGGHRVALAFDCGTPSDVDRVYADLVGAGHHGHLAPWDAFWGQRYASVLDPDDNAVELFATLEPTADAGPA
jgi:catechol 2,3-dioxygenase-like lactoylglutathione lyase family enzyme